MSQIGTVVLFGATGLVGGACLTTLAGDPRVRHIVAPGRRPLSRERLGGPDAFRVEERVIDFDDPAAFTALPPADALFCALGTTIRKAGSRESFRKVDFDYPLALARAGLESGIGHFLLVSALGANARSRFFYNRVKGELEDALRALPFPSVTIVRPSLLLGGREEFRIGEEIGKRLSFLAPRRLAPVHAADVAAALVQAALEERPGVRVIESAEIPVIADAYRSGRSS